MVSVPGVPGKRGPQRRLPGSARLRHGVAVALSVALALGALGYVLLGTDLAAVRAAVARVPRSQLARSLELTATSFACLGLHDWIGTRIVARGRVRALVALIAGAAGSAVANLVGFHALSGTAVRARLYLAAGLGAVDVARIASLAWLALFAGNAAMFGGAELVQAAAEGRAGAHLAIGLALFAALAALVAWLARGERELVVFGHRFPLPPAPFALAQVAVGAVESATAVGALYVLLPADLAPPFGIFAAGCIVAVALGVAAHTPGGIGVFEAGITTLLAARGRADLVAALLLYRVVYALLPFAIAVLVLGTVATPNRIRRSSSK